MFLCYDIKGIQQFIFSVPKLKCVIGASSIIAQFDENAKALGNRFSAERIFSGGGRGVYACEKPELVQELCKELVDEAHEVGLDIRIGTNPSLSDAVQNADKLYPYCPRELTGEPCIVSGLWPVPSEPIANVKRGVHPLIWNRIVEARHDKLGTQILEDLCKAGLVPEALRDFDLHFFKNVSPDKDTAEDEHAAGRDEAEARAGRAAIGSRNRWAVIAMDGNDMGRQFEAYRKLSDANNWNEGRHRRWLGAMSSSLSDCTRQAFLDAVHDVLCLWVADCGKDIEHCRVNDERNPVTNRLILPLRPLIIGGDDVSLLCHPAYAIHFVQCMSKRFTELSQIKAKQAAQELKMPLWPATNGKLTISAGILFAKVSFPLHMAIPYAESLLASAKGEYRATDENDGNKATPAAIDWEAITDSLVDSPTDRRNRELRFIDYELGDNGHGVKVNLTRKPYVLEPISGKPDLGSLLKLKKELGEETEGKEIPTSIRASILPALQKPWSERVAFFASIAKRHKSLKDMLWEGDKQLGSQWSGDSDSFVRSTGVPDAFSLLEEDHRIASAK